MVQRSSYFDHFSRINVMIVGDVMIDRYLTGQVNRISPEAPVPVVQMERMENRLGGAANVALNIKAMGATPYLFSVIGRDENGKILSALLPEAGISEKGLLYSGHRPTTVKTRVLANHQHLLRIDQEITDDLGAEEQRALLELIRETLDNKDIHVILFQDYNKGVLSHSVISSIMLEAIKRDIPTIVDPKDRNFWSYKHVTLFKPNLKEIRAQVPLAVQPDLASLQQAAQHIHRVLGNQHTMITLSEKGLFIGNESQGEIFPTYPRNIADVCGAGDTVVSVAALGLGLGIPLRDIAILANLAGGQVCEKVGVVPVDRNQLLREFQSVLSQH